MKSDHHKRVPAVILGGTANALSIVRSLGGAGVECYAINYPQSPVKYSRFCKWIDVPQTQATQEEAWAGYLTGHESDHLRGAVLLAASDEAIELLAKHRETLSERFRLDLSNPKAQLCMLNKLCTYQAAQRAGVPTPKFWITDKREQIETLKDELTFPLIVKPYISHQYKAKFNTAFVCVRTFVELLNAFDATCRAGVKTFLVEVIPGGDEKLCSYYTYIDGKGDNLINFTKRMIRRFPVTVGTGVYHVADYVPGVKELSLKLFREVGLQGIANAEFKLDTRDGELKLIECNARFTAADCLLVASGLNLSSFVYNRLAGYPQPAPVNFRLGMRLWYPVRDFSAYRQLNKMGLLSFYRWVRSILHPQIFPFFRWDDYLPSIMRPVVGTLRRLGARFAGKQVSTTTAPSSLNFTYANDSIATGRHPRRTPK